MTDDHGDVRTGYAADDEAIDDLIGPARHVVLSPHYDDMPLSMGATAVRLTANGRLVTDLVVFGAEPVGVELHRFAADHHIAWGLSAAEVIAARRAEEATATAILGAHPATMSLFDAIYRGDHYTSDTRLFGTPATAEDELPARIVAEAIAATLGGAATSDAAVRYYAPLAVGGHVDHRLAFRAARLLHESGHDVWLYEDLPYAMIGTNLSERLEAIAAEGLAIEVAARVPVTAAAWDRKLDAILAYPSQLQTVFGNYAGVDPTRPGIDAALDRYHRQAGDGQPVERFWRFTPDAG